MQARKTESATSLRQWLRVRWRLFVGFDTGETALAGLVDGFFGAAIVPETAQLPGRGGRARSLLARPRFRLRGFLSLAGEAACANLHASAAGPFRTALAAIRLVLVCVSFARPFVL